MSHRKRKKFEKRHFAVDVVIGAIIITNEQSFDEQHTQRYHRFLNTPHRIFQIKPSRSGVLLKVISEREMLTFTEGFLLLRLNAASQRQFLDLPNTVIFKVRSQFPVGRQRHKRNAGRQPVLLQKKCKKTLPQVYFRRFGPFFSRDAEYRFQVLIPQQRFAPLNVLAIFSDAELTVECETHQSAGQSHAENLLAQQQRLREAQNRRQKVFNRGA